MDDTPIMFGPHKKRTYITTVSDRGIMQAEEADVGYGEELLEMLSQQEKRINDIRELTKDQVEPLY